MVVPVGYCAVGVNTIWVFPLAQEMVPAMPAGAVIEKADWALLMSIASEKFTTIFALRGTPLAPLGGPTLTMVGGVVSVMTPVMNDDENALASALPEMSVAPTPTPTVYIVL